MVKVRPSQERRQWAVECLLSGWRIQWRALLLVSRRDCAHKAASMGDFGPRAAIGL